MHHSVSITSLSTALLINPLMTDYNRHPDYTDMVPPSGITEQEFFYTNYMAILPKLVINSLIS